MSEKSKELEAPKPAVHSDSEKSAIPDRKDRDRQHAPNDPPSKVKGEEPPVG